MKRRRAVPVALLLAFVVLLSGCKIVRIDSGGDAPVAGFDAASYASGLWTQQVLPHFAGNARPATEVLPAMTSDLAAAGARYGYRAGEGSPWSFIVADEGTVSRKNTDSRAGTLVLSLAGGDAPLEATLQIGPVIRGNAVRDALPFVSFKDFTNQLEYANAGKALTALALEGFAADVEAIAAGDRVRFTGAISISKAGDDVLITPIMLEKVVP